MSFHKNKESGFTIIEVVLVLAIAGLIFLIVFLALPQLQRSRRDTQRRNDVGRVLASLEQYAANNNGQYPDGATAAEFQSFLSSYFIDLTPPVVGEYEELSDPSTGAFTLNSQDGYNPGDEPDAIGQLYYYQGAYCNGQTIVNDGSANRQVVVATFLEQGGVYCGDNGGS